MAKAGGSIGGAEAAFPRPAHRGLAQRRHISNRGTRERTEHGDEDSPVCRHRQPDVGLLAQILQATG